MLDPTAYNAINSGSRTNCNELADDCESDSGSTSARVIAEQHQLVSVFVAKNRCKRLIVRVIRR